MRVVLSNNNDQVIGYFDYAHEKIAMAGSLVREGVQYTFVDMIQYKGALSAKFRQVVAPIDITGIALSK